MDSFETPRDAASLSVSVVVPVYNERDSLNELFGELSAVLEPRPGSWEVIFVDDGSKDGSAAVLAQLARRSPNIRVIEFRRNFGKAAALDAGFRAAAGEVVITMDADLQDDPAEIPRFLAAIAAGHEVVSGWKKQRHDPLNKTLPSRVFNRVVSRVSGLRLNDFNCGFKAYVREAVQDLRLYGEMHRFIPVLLFWRGFRVTEIAVNHRARRFGRSKYGMARLVKGCLDLMTVVLNTRYAARPLHIFGILGIAMGGLGALCLAYLTLVWLVGTEPIGGRPLLILGALLVIAGLQVLTVGLLGEFIQRHNSRQDENYTIRRTQNMEGPPATVRLLRRMASDLADQPLPLRRDVA